MADHRQFKPQLSQVPVSTLAKVIARGLDPAQVPSCAVPKKDEIKGCSWAVNCAKRVFGKDEFGGFGPKSSAPGSAGDGPRNVGYFDSDGASGLEREDSCTCHHFMAGKYGRFRQQDEHGNVVDIVAQEGEAITTRRLVPEFPDVPGEKRKHLSGMVMVEETVIVPKRIDPLDVVPRSTQRAREREERRAAVSAMMRGRTPRQFVQAVGEAQDEADDVLDFDTEEPNAITAGPVVDGVVAEAVEDAPRGRARNRG